MKFRRVSEDFRLQDLQKVLGAISRFMCPKTKLFPVKFRRNSEVFYLQVLQKMLQALYHDFCIQKPSSLPWVQTYFGSFRFAKCMKISGRICMIYTSRNEVVWHEVQTYFWSCMPVRFTESFGRNFTIYASKNEAVSLEIQTHFRSFLPARFAEKVLGAISWFMHPKTKLFPVKFRRISKVFRLQDLQKVLGEIPRFMCPRRKLFEVKFRIFWTLYACKVYRKFWVQFHDLCVQKQSCLLWSSDAFWKFSLGRFTDKVLGALSRFMCPKMKLFPAKFRLILDVFTLRGW